MSVRLATPGRIAVVSVPIVGFFATPFLPFAVQPTLWLGLPAVLVWTALMVILSVVALQIVEMMYLRAGGREADAAELERLQTEALVQLRDERIAAEREASDS